MMNIEGISNGVLEQLMNVGGVLGISGASHIDDTKENGGVVEAMQVYLNIADDSDVLQEARERVRELVADCVGDVHVSFRSVKVEDMFDFTRPFSRDNIIDTGYTDSGDQAPDR